MYKQRVLFTIRIHVEESVAGICALHEPGLWPKFFGEAHVNFVFRTHT